MERRIQLLKRNNKLFYFTIVLCLNIWLSMNVVQGFNHGRMRKMTSTCLLVKKPNREDEIRRKINQLKREGRLRKNDNIDDVKVRKKITNDSYEDKIRSKLGNKMNLYEKMIDDDEKVDDDEVDMDSEEEELIDAVTQKLQEEPLNKMKKSGVGLNEEPLNKMKTSGVGGTWIKNETLSNDTYRPSRGSWGYFERPKDISKTYGGGKRVGVGFQTGDEEQRLKSEQSTREKLQQYREKAGIDVQSEKDNAALIEEAMSLASRANMRGMYGTAVSSLEKITQYCSSNSKLGGDVFLELAMAYEAVGRTSESVTIYSTLCKSPIDRVRTNAQKLLYGLEAMNFMREVNEDFSRKKIRNTFIDTTGLSRIADNFDNVYNTAYVDLEKGGKYYKKLSSSIVRSAREARQILLKATSSEEVSRLKVVQALRSLNRNFNEALAKERKNEIQPKQIAVINGVPIKKPSDSSTPQSMESFTLPAASSILDNLNGEWRLQLMADSSGDGVTFYNTTIAWMVLDSTKNQYKLSFSSGLNPFSSQDSFQFDPQKRILIKNQPPKKSFLDDFFTNKDVKIALLPQQVITVDSVLCVTRLADVNVKEDNTKKYFSVWKKVPPKTYNKT